MTDSNAYEMFWDCPYCGTAELLGKTHRHCPACGAAQDAEARYFPPEDRKVAVEDHVRAGGFGSGLLELLSEREDASGTRPAASAGAHSIS